MVAEVEDLDLDGVRTAEVGIGIWVVCFIALLPFYGRLVETGRLWWLWTCLAGVGLGLVGLEYCRRRRKARAEHLAMFGSPTGSHAGPRPEPSAGLPPERD